MPVFLAPWFLLASLAAAIPVAIHLLHKRRPKPVPFSSLRFIQEAVAKTRRSRNLTHIAALLMRVLIILLLAAAFARPKVRFAGWLPEGPRTVVLVLDGSASMRFRDGEKTDFEKGRDWARQVLAGLEDADRAALVVLGREDPWLVFPPISDHPVLFRALADAKPGFGRADLVQALRNIVKRLDEAGEKGGVEVHLFSDFQESNWNSVEAEHVAADLARRRVVLCLDHVEPAVAADAAIAGAEFYPPAILGNGGFTASAKVLSSPDYRGPNSLRLFVGKTEQKRQAFSLRPAQTLVETVSGRVSGKQAGLVGRLEIENDALPEDNVFYFSLPRFPGVPVLLVDGSTHSAANSTEDTLFLRFAIQPRSHGEATTLFLPRVVDWPTFLSSDPRRFPAVFVSNPPSFTRTAAMRITEYCRNGGAAVLFPGGFAALEHGLSQLAPLRGLRVRKEVRNEESSVQLLPSEKPSPLEKRLRRFLPGNPTFVLRRRLRFSRLPKGAGVVFQYDDGAPFAFSVPLGRGVLWVVSVSAGRDWSDWPLTPCFVIFQQELIRGAARRNLPNLMGRVGKALTLSWPENATELDLKIQGPGGSARMVHVKRRDPADPIVLDGFQVPGTYRIEDGAQRQTVAINLPEAEERMVFLKRRELAFALRATTVYQASSWHELQDELAGVREGRPLWPVLLAAAFFLAVAEELFANFRSRAAALPEALQRFLRGGGHAA